jgi:hypothetical protein
MKPIEIIIPISKFSLCPIVELGPDENYNIRILFLQKVTIYKW